MENNENQRPYKNEVMYDGPDPEEKETESEKAKEPELGTKPGLGSKGKLAFTERKRWLFFGLPFTFTVVELYENDILIRKGLFNIKENDCYMYRVSDVQLTRSFIQRWFGLGTVTCFTSDVTNKTIVLKNIRHSREIKDFIYQSSEECKLRRRTVNMQNIGAVDYIDDVEDLIE